MSMRGPSARKLSSSIFVGETGAKYVLPFKIRYDKEDVHGGHRTKYYLLHASNHVKAALLMKEVMWPLEMRTERLTIG